MRTSIHRNSKSPTHEKKLLKQIINIIVKSFDKVGMFINRNTYNLLITIASCSISYVSYILSQYPSYSYNQIRSLVNVMNKEQKNFLMNQIDRTVSKSDDIKSCVTGKAISWALFSTERKEDYLTAKRMLEKTNLNIQNFQEVIEDSLNTLNNNLVKIFAFKFLNIRVEDGDNFGDIINAYIINNKKLIGTSEYDKKLIGTSEYDKKLIGSSEYDKKLIGSLEYDKSLALIEKDDDIKNNEIQKYTEKIFEIQPYANLIYKDKNIDKYIAELPETQCGLLFKQFDREINLNLLHSSENIAQEINHDLERLKYRLDTDYETVSLTMYITLSLFLIIIANKIFYTYRSRCFRRCDGKRKSRNRKNKSKRKSNKNKSKRKSNKNKSKRSFKK
jgi:hypothetical protein